MLEETLRGGVTARTWTVTPGPVGGRSPAAAAPLMAAVEQACAAVAAAAVAAGAETGFALEAARRVRRLLSAAPVETMPLSQ